MLSEHQKLLQIIDLGADLARFSDLDILLERVLSLARRFVNAEAGSLYIRDGASLQFAHTQNELLERRLPAGKKLVYTTFSIPVDDQSLAGSVAKTGSPLNIGDVYQIASNKTYHFNKTYDEKTGYHTQSVLTVPLIASQGNVVGVLQLINARNEDGALLPFDKADEPFVVHFANSAAMAIERAQMTRALILRAIKMAEMRDPTETGPHVNRVGAYAVAIYETWAARRGMEDEEVAPLKDVLRMGAMLHDVGKVAIPDRILKKPGRLTQEEFEVIKQHPMLGAQLFSEQYSPFDGAAHLIALTHHERWDGTGYPGFIDPMTGATLPGHATADGKARGKKGEEIPPFGRVAAIADVYDALSRRRVYKEPWEEERVLETMEAESGKHFDPEMIAAFFTSLEGLRAISKRYPDMESAR